ncbi:hypothetical protein [Streptomyces sp. NPDC091212]|uniref:hypothetical protein n=1 Tax=Streptomyces sp. NPDC091212 TaxID=3155191 RepID=UPI00341F536B
MSEIVRAEVHVQYSDKPPVIVLFSSTIPVDGGLYPFQVYLTPAEHEAALTAAVEAFVAALPARGYTTAAYLVSETKTAL